jgi:uncharacterized protein
MKILITGATGLIGRAISRRLADEGHQIVVLSRHPESAEVVAGAKAYNWEPELGPPERRVWEGVDAVIHLAGESIAASRWTDEQKRRIRDSRVIGTRRLIEGMKEASDRPKILVSGSAVGFYGNRGDERLDEWSEPGRGFLPEVCQQWEREALRGQDLGLRVTTVRTGVVLSTNGGPLEKMLMPFRLGLGGRMGNGRQWFPWIHLEDIAGIFCHALSLAELSVPINGVAPGIVMNEEFTRELAAVLHRPVFLAIPDFVLKVAMGEMAQLVLDSQRVTPRVALETGYRFRFQILGLALRSLLEP